MRIELHISGMSAVTVNHANAIVFERYWLSPPRKGDLVHLAEFSEPARYGLVAHVLNFCPRDMRVDDVLWGPFEDMDDVDVIVKCHRQAGC